VSILLLTLAAALSLAGCGREQSRTAPLAGTVRGVSVITVEKRKIPDLLEAVGTVRAAQTSAVSSQMMGNIVEIPVHEGDRVQRGQVLAVIDDSQARTAVERSTAADAAAQQQLVGADSELALTESTLKRYQTLFEKKSISAQEFDEIKARHQTALARRDMARAERAQAQAGLNQARTSQAYTRVRAPFDGVVTEKKADVGTLASPGVAIFTVEDVRRYRLEVAVNESDLRYLRKGQQVLANVDALDHDALDHNHPSLKGKVVEIVPAADAASRSFLVKVELPTDAGLRSGLFGQAEFSRGEREAVLIPQSAVVERGQLQGVFVLDQNKVANLRYITLGKRSDSAIEVLTGLQDGEQIVAEPGAGDFNGKRVEAN
jgi:multidrug efflux system membrane fusion protein